MKLISDIELENILKNLKVEQSIAGGSVANSIVGLSHLKNDVAFIGKLMTIHLVKCMKKV